MTLHNQIMNIQTDRMDPYIRNESAYKLGHRDARHAAAELALKYDALIENLKFWFSPEEINKLKEGW